MTQAYPQAGLFSGDLPANVERLLREQNPWWAEQPGPQIPSFRRAIFPRLLRLLEQGLTPAVVLRGPRRIGKTILLRQVIEELAARGVGPQRILYLPFDEIEALHRLHEPVLQCARWFQKSVLGKTLNQAAHEGAPAYLLFDEVQNLKEWAPQIKNLVDNNTVRVAVTGSSSLRIAAGRDSLAGRITTLELGPLLLREIATLCGESLNSNTGIWTDNGASDLRSPDFWREAVTVASRDITAKDAAFAAFSTRGAYPFAHERPDAPWPDVAAYLNESVIERAIKHDLRLGERGRRRDERLLQELFRLCCRYAGQSPGEERLGSELRQTLDANVGRQRLQAYLKFLDGTLPLKLIEPHELRLRKRHGAVKMCLCDHALRASWFHEAIPLAPEVLTANPHLSDLAGHIAESALGYYLGTVPASQVSWFPARQTEPEVDFVVTVGDQRIPIEVKYQRRIDPQRDTHGLRAFIEKSAYNAPFGLLVTMEDGVGVPDPRIITLSLATFLWLR